ncbi:uncharacterized protein LOC121926626 [Sceloporus undulatus]|uniref:uncharacterized protein LOC121926626 n=1 Tax=Sceloporus undulatus TaxID=8520 RepID=UPI001C4C472C|nr:uncharacterized protein LOC121926626 [Sceloporus undulatus]
MLERRAGTRAWRTGELLLWPRSLGERKPRLGEERKAGCLPKAPTGELSLSLSLGHSASPKLQSGGAKSCDGGPGRRALSPLGAPEPSDRSRTWRSGEPKKSKRRTLLLPKRERERAINWGLRGWRRALWQREGSRLLGPQRPKSPLRDKAKGLLSLQSDQLRPEPSLLKLPLENPRALSLSRSLSSGPRSSGSPSPRRSSQPEQPRGGRVSLEGRARSGEDGGEGERGSPRGCREKRVLLPRVSLGGEKGWISASPCRGPGAATEPLDPAAAAAGRAKEGKRWRGEGSKMSLASLGKEIP